MFRTAGVPVIRGSNLSSDVGIRLVDEGLVFVDPSLADRFKRSVVVPGDLVFTCWGTINQVGLIDHKARHPQYIISNKQMKFTTNRKIANPIFYYYWFSGPIAQQQILSSGIGSSVPGFNLGQLRTMLVPVPPMSEQDGITDLLGSLDDRIELNRRMAETLEVMARVLFKSWFVDFDPVHARAEGRSTGLPDDLATLFPDSFGEDGMPGGWLHSSIADLALINPRTLIETSEGPYVDMAALPTAGPSITRVVQRAVGSGARFRNGDTLVARITPCLENGKTALVDCLTPGEVGWGSTEFIVLRPGPHTPPSLLYLVARHQPFREALISSMSGTSGRQRVPADAVMRWIMAVPSEPVLRAFDGIVSPLFTRITLAARQTDKLAALRDTLLPKLISGELRITDAERQIAAA